MSAVIRAAMQSLTITDVMDDTGGMLPWLDGQDKVEAWSGRLRRALHERAVRDRRGVALSAYEGGGRAVRRGHGDRQARVAASRRRRDIKGEVYVGFAETDPAVPEHVPPALKSALEKAGTRHVQETIPDTHHGFMFAARADYNPVAAEETWAKLFALWDRNLK